jgi:hypothetical protein
VADGAAPTHHVIAGYEDGKLLGEAMEAACKDGDLTRASVVDHLRQISDFGADGQAAIQAAADPHAVALGAAVPLSGRMTARDGGTVDT